MTTQFVGADGPLRGGGLAGLLADDDPMWLVADVVDGLDLSGFEAAYRADGSGGRPYDPRLLLTAVLHCYRLGIRAPERISAAIRDRIDLRLLFGGRVPAGRTVRRFVVRHTAAVQTLFVQVLAACGRAGLVDVAVTATDGSPMRAAAALSANRSRARIGLALAQARQRLDELTEASAAAAGALDPGGPDPGRAWQPRAGDIDTDLGEYIETVCRRIPAEAARLGRRITRLHRAETVAQTRAQTHQAAAAAAAAQRLHTAQTRVTRLQQRLHEMITAQDAKVAAYQTRAAAAAARGRRPDGREPVPTSRSQHITRQRTALANARHRLTHLRAGHHP
ncbi:transposase [Dactylosporangium sp. CA-092794]|uniref:transposase n=1 Tax=Dactylosporangium sp. CA-092794 TaxID=3239929 RepID=UPI003D8CA5AE